MWAFGVSKISGGGAAVAVGACLVDGFLVLLESTDDEESTKRRHDEGGEMFRLGGMNEWNNDWRFSHRQLSMAVCTLARRWMERIEMRATVGELCFYIFWESGDYYSVESLSKDYLSYQLRTYHFGLGEYLKVTISTILALWRTFN